MFLIHLELKNSMNLCGNNFIFINQYIYFVGDLSKNKIIYQVKMDKPYSFSNEQMNGIVEDTYTNIIKECENFQTIINYGFWRI